MANLNKVFLMGNLTADPELRYTPKGTAVTSLRLAVNRHVAGAGGSEGHDEATYVDVTLWGKAAEVAGQYLAKGRGVFVEGRLQLESWEDKASGQKRSKLSVVGENIQLFPKGGDSGASGGAGNYRGNHGSSPPASSAAGADELLDEDIPF